MAVRADRDIVAFVGVIDLQLGAVREFHALDVVEGLDDCHAV